MKKRFLGLAFSPLLLISCAGTVPLEVSTDSVSHLFMASGVDQYRIDLNFYNLDGTLAMDTQRVTLADPRASSRFETASNDSVQYDPELGVFLFATHGRAEMDGEICLNADKTCNDRLYQWKPGDAAPQVFWDSMGSISGFVLDSKTHTVWVNALTDIFEKDYDGKSTPTLVELHLESGEMVKKALLSSEGPLHLSADGSVITQVIAQDAHSGQISFAQIDFAQPSMQNPQPLFFLDLAFDSEQGTQWAEAYLSGLSPDAQHFAYVLNRSSEEADGVSSSLVLSDMKQDSLGQILDFEGDVSNYNIYWSGDSSHFAVGTRAGVRVYDVATGLSSLISDQDEGIAFWAPSSHHLITAKDANFIVHDLEFNTTTNLSSSFTDWPLGISFY